MVSEIVQSETTSEYICIVPFSVYPVINQDIYGSDEMILETHSTEIQYKDDSYLVD
ncbi:hypothetical protein [Bacillus sp. IBL03825]|uniref:hypothetical protein n=1 Tax=Bacillus sp. IBL03825 TaxID=2953580 RepID=UPI0021580C61|nr:hypothetical protein [Bacillus sp. IBL03825]MCR6850468.1 hypothetical protein [Bacillus sp. IBL03825]